MACFSLFALLACLLHFNLPMVKTGRTIFPLAGSRKTPAASAPEGLFDRKQKR
jgi:hypothetical protein